MEKVACNLCGETRQRVILKSRDHLNPDKGWFDIVRCRSCGLVFVNPRPTAEEIRRFYPSGYGSRFQTLKKKKTSFYKRIPALLFRDPDIPERLESDPYFTKRRGRVLDVGTGGGELLLELHGRGWEATGLEPFCEPSAPAKELGLDIRRVSFEEAELPSGHFDVVLMSHALEHMHRPLEALRKAASLLAPGGMAYVEVPNFGSASRRVFGQRWAHLEVPRHLNQFTPRTIRMLANRAGLHLARIRHVAASHALRETLLRIFISRKHGGSFPCTLINRLLRTPAAKIAAALVSGVLALLKTSDHVGYYLIKE
jgi:2-polyprenyl-3-methyl-5-hydroxy-6-metoxy-1,4-benzoquinol methylase